MSEQTQPKDNKKLIAGIVSALAVGTVGAWMLNNTIKKQKNKKYQSSEEKE